MNERSKRAQRSKQKQRNGTRKQKSRKYEKSKTRRNDIFTIAHVVWQVLQREPSAVLTQMLLLWRRFSRPHCQEENFLHTNLVMNSSSPNPRGLAHPLAMRRRYCCAAIPAGVKGAIFQQDTIAFHEVWRGSCLHGHKRPCCFCWDQPCSKFLKFYSVLIFRPCIARILLLPH